MTKLDKEKIINFFRDTTFPCETKECEDALKKNSCSIINCPLCLKERNESPNGITIEREIKLCKGLMNVVDLKENLKRVTA